jgi:hypothetical protein
MGIGGVSLRRLAALWVGSLALAPIMAGADDLTSKIKIHGFLSQAWATTDGEQYLGIPDDGTTDYRNLALQLRFQLADRQSLVFQLGHESRGESPRDLVREEVEIDWAFYEAHLSKMSVRVGRIPLPLGIYSELRDAGHLLPFYGPPVTVYGETSYASESIDGVGLNFAFLEDSPWSLELDLFGGQSTISEKSRTQGIKIADTENEWGARLWLNTPVEGLRVGLNHHEWKTEDSLVFRNGEIQELSYLSLDWTRDRWLVRSEYGRGDFALAQLGAEVDFGYATIGYSPLPKFWVYLQSERRELSLTPKAQPDRRVHDSIGISLTYAVSERVVIKLEHQDLDTTDLDRLLGPLEIPNVKATIASISVAY